MSDCQENIKLSQGKGVEDPHNPLKHISQIQPVTTI